MDWIKQDQGQGNKFGDCCQSLDKRWKFKVMGKVALERDGKLSFEHVEEPGIRLKTSREQLV